MCLSVFLLNCSEPMDSLSLLYDMVSSSCLSQREGEKRTPGEISGSTILSLSASGGPDTVGKQRAGGSAPNLNPDSVLHSNYSGSDSEFGWVIILNPKSAGVDFGP